MTLTRRDFLLQSALYGGTLWAAAERAAPARPRGGGRFGRSPSC